MGSGASLSQKGLRWYHVGRSEVRNFRKKPSSWKFSTIRKVTLRGEEGALGPSQTETGNVKVFLI